MAYYGVLWWRQTGELPAHFEVRYLENVDAFILNAADLQRVEHELGTRIREATVLLLSAPAEARMSEMCGLCDVRQFCDSYWLDKRSLARDLRRRSPVRQFLDIEVTVSGDPTPNGFDAALTDGGQLHVVFDDHSDPRPFSRGEQLRIRGGLFDANTKELRLTKLSEIFHCPGA